MIKKWWMESVGYQIYPKSFFDANQDGIGDLKGITQKLPYLKDLGVNLIWICPVYDSPMDDNGYDVRNFFKINPMFGNIEDMKELIHIAHQLDIKIVMDYVLNHTSDEHPWFIESRKNKDNPYRDYYIWQDPKMKDGKRVEPTNWGSFFGGSCWAYDEHTDSYYMKIFSDKMPDLNWSNQVVRDEMISVGAWWLDLGVDGFRIDAVSHLDRAPFEDILNAKDKYPLDWFKFSNLPKVHDYLKELNQKLFKPYDCLTIGEVGGEASITSAEQYAGFSSNELSMVFNFDHNWCNNLSDVTEQKDLITNVKHLKEVFMKWQYGFKDKGWLPLNWLIHDQPRLMSHYGDFDYYNQSAKMLATTIHLMRGTPFIYQGEEIGMTNYPFNSVEEFDDISSINHYHYELNLHDPKIALKKAAMRSRDNGRTPMQWSNEPFAGFSKVKPWFPVNPDYTKINVTDELQNEDSIINYYKKLTHLRRHSKYRELIIYGDIKFVELHDDLITYERSHEQQKILVINSYSNQKMKIDLNAYQIKELILTNDDIDLTNKKHIELKPYQSLVLDVEV